MSSEMKTLVVLETSMKCYLLLITTITHILSGSLLRWSIFAVCRDIRMVPMSPMYQQGVIRHGWNMIAQPFTIAIDDPRKCNNRFLRFHR